MLDYRIYTVERLAIGPILRPRSAPRYVPLPVSLLRREPGVAPSAAGAVLPTDHPRHTGFAGRRPRAVAPPSRILLSSVIPCFRRSPPAEFTAALHLSASLRDDHLRSHLLPTRHSRVALLRSLFANAAPILQHLNSFGLRNSFKQIVLSHSKTPPFGGLLPHLHAPQKHKRLFSQASLERPCTH